MSKKTNEGGEQLEYSDSTKSATELQREMQNLEESLEEMRAILAEGEQLLKEFRELNEDAKETGQKEIPTEGLEKNLLITREAIANCEKLKMEAEKTIADLKRSEQALTKILQEHDGKEPN